VGAGSVIRAAQEITLESNRSPEAGSGEPTRFTTRF
jgi:hypothetical protein